MFMPRTAQRKYSGQALIEFVLSIPLLLLVLVSMLYFGRVYYVKQVILYAAQEGARAAARTPELDDPDVRDMVRGFTLSGGYTNYYSPIAGVLGAANMLSFGDCGDLPAKAAVKILPWDSDGSYADYTPPGTVAVRVIWPFSLMRDPFSGQVSGQTTDVAIPVDVWGAPIKFPDFEMSEMACSTPEIYQKGEYQ